MSQLSNSRSVQLYQIEMLKPPPRKSLKMLQQDLPLPKIIEKVPVRFPRTSSQSRKTKQQHKYCSETACSPQEEHLQDQIRNVLTQRYTKMGKQNHKSSISKGLNLMKRHQTLLPPLQECTEMHKQTPNLLPPSPYRASSKRRKSSSSKHTLFQILQNQKGFVECYFAQIGARIKK